MDEAHSPPMPCLHCGLRLLPEEMRKHRERCEGAKPPHARDAWVSRADAIAAGVPLDVMVRAIVRGLMRTRDDGSVLLRDVERYAQALELLRP